MMLRYAAPGLAALSLLAAPAGASDLTALSDQERDAFGAEVRQYLLENPEVIVEAINILEQRQAEAEALADEELVAAKADELFNDGYSWVGGNPDGDVTLVEFMDYRCGFCRRAVPEVDQVLKEDGNIRLVIKEFPILGEASMISSRFAIATKQVAGDDAYKQVHDALMAYDGDVNDTALRRIGEGLGLDVEPILAAMEGEAVTQQIARTRALAQELKISGTPTFVLDSEMLRGYLPADRMLDLVNEIRNDRG
ncbi:Protein-disulfide isomerase [Cribrihabitans marinus]|uniref:Protein-disulfide isomerase n=1 Tax=Cribrihabitans marinus TaxID=1227549 RepID=A0A1H6QWM3_9RHOB|nr:DsbA family protein [Cribrihabitans marinus]GGH20035.1 DSBA oxidoreductase [Cribrihabitans marinus]SEI48101.1 Protein-disulfide isomerase [Cribrihabitans marinus]